MVQGLTLAGRLADARKAAATVRAEAEATGWPQLRAEAAFAEGDIMAKFGLDAEAPLLDAVRLAGAANDDRLTARALAQLVHVLGGTAQKAGDALLVADIADGVLARAGNDPKARAQLLRFRGAALARSLCRRWMACKPPPRARI